MQMSVANLGFATPGNITFYPGLLRRFESLRTFSALSFRETLTSYVPSIKHNRILSLPDRRVSLDNDVQQPSQPASSNRTA